MRKIFDLVFILISTCTLLWLHHSGFLWIYLEEHGYISKSSTGMRFFVMLGVYAAVYIAFVVLVKALRRVFKFKKRTCATSAFTFSMVIVFFSLMIFADSAIDIRRENSAVKCSAQEATSNQFCFFELEDYTPLVNSFHSVYGSLGGKSAGVREPWYRFYITVRDNQTNELFPLDLGTAFVDRHSADRANLKQLREKILRPWKNQSRKTLKLIRSRDVYDGGVKESYPAYLKKNVPTGAGAGPVMEPARLSSKVFAIYSGSSEARDIFWYVKRTGFWTISVLYCLIGLVCLLVAFSQKEK